MKQEIIFQILIILTAVIFPGCKQIYEPSALKKNPGFLVVDGFLNNGLDTTFIKLTRTNQLQAGTWNVAELNADMFIEDVSGNTIYSFRPLNEEGVYFLPTLSLDVNKKYKLRINTIDKREYRTDEITIIKTPSIDSISWKKADDGIQIYATTHDALKNTRYYRWDYTETWEYRSYFYTPLKYENDSIKRRKLPEEQVSRCWTIQNSTDLLLASSNRLSDDIIFEQPIRLIPYHTIEIGVKYSILLRQYGLTDSAFSYLQYLKKNTEQTGSFFDPQPGQIPGNIHCISDPAEDVIGFITASSLETKRIFIEKVEVLPWDYRLYCDNSVIFSKEEFADAFGGFHEYTPISEIFAPGTGEVIAAEGATTLCTDCTSRGGTNVKPDFWP